MKHESAGRNLEAFSARLQLLTESPIAWLWVRRVLLLMILLWLCFSLAKLILVLLPDPDLPAPPPVAAGVSTNSSENASTPAVNIEKLISLDLFGKPSSAQVAEAPTQVLSLPETNAEDTKLNLQLRGVLMSTDPKAARAIIANGSKQDLYAVDDVLPVGHNVKLAKVLAERVILNNAGRPESLWLYDEANKPGASSNSGAYYRPPQQSPQSQQSPPSFAATSEYNPGATDVAMEREASESSDLSDEVASVTGAKNLTDVVKMSVERRNGQVVGYKIRPGREADLFTELGFEAGDIVTSINGIQLDSSNKVMQVYRELKDQTSATLTLLRGDEEMTMDITL